MAFQTVGQVLASYKAPYINGNAAGLAFAPAFLVGLYQGLIEKDGKGVDDNFVTSELAESNTQIAVHRLKPVKVRAREIGSNKNGAAYSQFQHFTTTETVGIEITQLLDEPILIPRWTKDHLPVDVLARYIQMFSDRVATVLNGLTFASKFLATYTAKAGVGEYSAAQEIRETVFDVEHDTGKELLKKFILANGKLDRGDRSHDIDTFDRKTRVCVIKTTFGPWLKAEGVINLGGANELYRIIKNGGLNGDGTRIEDDGFVGEIDGVEVREIADIALGYASTFLGFPEEELIEGDVLGYIASSYANARGVSTSKQTQVVDEVNGQGSRILPYVICGAKCWYQLGNSFLVENNVDIFGKLKTLFTGKTIAYKLKGEASRLYPTLGTITFASTTSASLTATAYDDNNNDHVVGAYYVVADAPIKTVGAFVKAATAQSANAGAATVSTGEVSVTIGTAITNNKYLNILAIADDGSCSLTSKKYTA